ncbi:MAG: DUF933 domain-containing protein, partial [Planctomycetota bacterium]
GREPEVSQALPVRVALEAELAELEEPERTLFREEYGVSEPCRDRVLAAIHSGAARISFFTVKTEVRAWSVPSGTSAACAAGAIHTDMERGFIRAEVVAFQDYLEQGGIAAAKEKGLLRLEGKDYPLQDGDILLFRHNV